MKNNYILVDFENVQPKSFASLVGHPFQIIVFVGANQQRIPLELAAALQPFGADARYLQIDGNGPNALDFHIAFYIGELAQADPNGFFHVISKDTGFDPLIRHLKKRKIFAQRHRDLAEIPLVRLSHTKTLDEKVDAIRDWLVGRGNARPRTLKTLGNSISALFMKKLEAVEIERLLQALMSRKLLALNGARLVYDLPS